MIFDAASAGARLVVSIKHGWRSSHDNKELEYDIYRLGGKKKKKANPVLIRDRAI